MKADRSKKPATISFARSFHTGLSHNRRIKFKDGRVINTWLLQNALEDLQLLCSAGPVDPEIGIICFRDLQDNPIAIIFHFTLHTNTNFGPKFSADYPGVVSARIKERFGKTITLFVPGASGDINSTGLTYRQIGDALADKIIAAVENAKPEKSPVFLSALKKEITVQRRNFEQDQTEKIEKSGWNESSKQIFYKELEQIKKEGKKQEKTLLQVWCIGNRAFASLPGELFIEHGIRIKEKSPFPFTYPVELGGDYVGYLITKNAWIEGGYESLIANSARISPEGVEKMVDSAVEMLNQIYQKFVDFEKEKK